MSGKPWTPERRAAQAAAMRKRWRDPAYRRDQSEKRRAAMADPGRRAAASIRMKVLNRRMQYDQTIKSKCVRGQKRVRRSPAFRAVQSAVMAELMARPEQRRRARFHCIRINKNPKVSKRQWAGRRRRRDNSSPQQA